MAILFYQLFIIMTLTITKVVSPKHLPAACLIWSVLTVVNVFWPPLIALQLIVIWVAFAILKSSESEKKYGGTTEERQSEVIKMSLPESERKGAVGGVSGFVYDLDRRVSIQSAVQKETSSFISACRMERYCLERAHEAAIRRVGIDRQFPKYSEEREIFDKTYQEILDNLKDRKARAIEQGSDKLFLVDLRIRPAHADPDIDEVIVRLVADEIDSYSQFIDHLLGRLTGADVKSYFADGLRRLNAEDLLIRLFCFRMGFDWRDIKIIEEMRPVVLWDEKALG